MMQLTSLSPGAVKEAPARPPARARQSSIRRAGIILLFLLPSALLYIVFVFLPMIQAAYYSLFSWNGLEPLQDFVGLQNFYTAFKSTVFTMAFLHNILILVFSLGLQLPLTLLLALIIGKRLPGRAFFRTIFFMPFILSEVITGVIWSFIYQPDGLINTTLAHLIPGYQVLWLASPQLVLGSIFFVMCWKYFGLNLVLYVAAIGNIPDEIEEAARIDGATPLQIVRHINIPLVASTIRLTMFLSALGSLQYFDLIYVMSNGGPIHASETMATYLYQYGFKSYEMGYGSAVGLIIFLICFVFSLMYQRLIMSRDLAGTGAQA
ncbi:MAG TPA: sugar ABC transporter permease [Ktedonosporobacter sp.]|nr:sugar ABC transporter permease [Ktedonosporobacter sp.]